MRILKAKSIVVIVQLTHPQDPGTCIPRIVVNTFIFFFFFPKFNFKLFNLILWFVSDFHLLWMLNCKLNRKLSICDPPLSPIQTSGAGGLFMPMPWPKNLPFIHKLKVIWQSAQCLSPGPLHFTLTPSLITVYPWTSHLRLSPLQFSPLKKLVW